MKIKSRLHTLLFSTIIIISIAISGCSNTMNGSKILSSDNVKGHNISSMKVTFFDLENRIKSPITTLAKDNEKEEVYIEEFRDIIMKSKGISFEEEDTFSPVSDSSHYIEVLFDNDYALDFYYSSEYDWLIWSNIVEKEDQKILEFHFLDPALSIEEWLSTISK